MKSESKFSSVLPVLALLSIVVILPACGDSSSDKGTDFSLLVTDLFAATADNTDPLAIDDLDLRFRDQNNQDTFGALLQ